MDLERNFKLKVRDNLLALNGEEFERFSKHILELALDEKVIHKGQNLYAKPVGYTADFANTQYEIIGQSGTDPDYFEDFQKPMKDIEGAIKNHGTVTTIYLFSNRYAGTSRLGDLIKAAKDNNITQKVLPYDAERIADTILDKIFASHITDEIFKYLPTAYELFKILPQNAQVPVHKDIYYEREEEEAVIRILHGVSVVQVYGLSGIGKTELTIGLARKLSKQFETVIWIDGDAYQNTNLDFSAIKILKFDKLVNLSTMLESHRLLVIFDNINDHTREVQTSFDRHNKKDSKCIISSLSRTLEPEVSFHLSEVTENIAAKILFGTGSEINEEKANLILNYTGKHPLILRIIQSAVKNMVLSWEDVISELSNIHQLTDYERNQTIANRIISRIKQSSEKELAAVHFLDNRLITQPILEHLIGKIGVTKLLNNTIIGKDDTKHYSIHQIILDSIKNEITNRQWTTEFSGKIKGYLADHNESKDIAFYNFIFTHSGVINQLLAESSDIEFKRIIVYSLIQCTDFKNTSQTDSLVREAVALIRDNTTYYEHLLSIELTEIRLFAIDKKKENDLYQSEAAKEIDRLTQLLPLANTNNHKTTLFHHIGKLYFKTGQIDQAIVKFEEVLLLKADDPFALLQIARIASVKKDMNKVKEVTSRIFSFQNCPLSILLSFYELISFSNYNELRSEYIDKDIDHFVSKLIDAIDSRYDQPYDILSRISGHLSYNYPDYFETIINNLPVPANIDFNETLRFSYAGILTSYFKFLKYHGEKQINGLKLQKTFLLARTYFESADLSTDYKRGTYIDLLIEAEEFDLAESEANKLNEENSFNYQKRSKIYRGQNRFPEAITAASEAIRLHLASGKGRSPFLAAFLNDKAEAENGDNQKVCLSTLTEAIKTQTNFKTKEDWSTKLSIWMEKYKGE